MSRYTLLCLAVFGFPELCYSMKLSFMEKEMAGEKAARCCHTEGKISVEKKGKISGHIFYQIVWSKHVLLFAYLIAGLRILVYGKRNSLIWTTRRSTTMEGW